MRRPLGTHLSFIRKELMGKDLARRRMGDAGGGGAGGGGEPPRRLSSLKKPDLSLQPEVVPSALTAAISSSASVGVG